MRIYIPCLFLCFLGSGMIHNLFAQSPHAENRRDGEIVYRLDGQAFLAEYVFNCVVQKGVYSQNFGLKDSIRVDFTQATGPESAQFHFSNLVFAEGSHRRNFRAEVRVLDFSGIQPRSTSGPSQWNSENSGGAEVVRLEFIPEEVPLSWVNFELRILDKGNELLGQAFFSRGIQFERKAIEIPPQPTPEPTPTVPISTLSEDDIWNIFLTENTVESFEKYRIMFPNGKYGDIAMKKILQLKEQNSWTSLSGRNTCNSYKNYLEIYPLGTFREEAMKRMKELDCSSTGLDSGSHDSNEFEDSREDDTANDIDLDLAAYNSALSIGTPKAYKEYLSAYPNGRYSNVLIQKIPFEVLQQDHLQDSLFSIVLAYVVPPLSVLRIEVAPDEFVFEKASSNFSIDGGNTFYWPEGKFKSRIHSIRGNIYRFEATLPTRKTYWVTLQDNTGQKLTLELDSKVRSMEILRASGLDATFDSLVVDVTGGLPPYYVRFVRRGEPFKNYEYESELLKTGSEFYIPKNELLDNTYLTGGIYDFYVLDKRKSQYKKYHLPVIFLLDAGVNPYLWQILAPIILILIIGLIVFYRKNAQNNTQQYPLSS